MATILVADDDPLLLKLVEHKLKSRGFAVDCATDGEAALEMAGERRPDLIVLDAMMPGIDGFEVLRRLSANPGTNGIPVIMLTARRLEADIVSALSLGAGDYLVKPFMPEELVMRIRKLLGVEAVAV